MNYKLMDIIFNICYVSIFFMYFQILPIDIESQPVIILLFIPVVMAIILKHRYVKKIDIRKNILLIIYLNIILFYALISILEHGTVDIFQVFRLIVCPIAYMFILRYVGCLKGRYVEYCIWGFFICFIIQLLNIPILNSILTNIYNTFFLRTNDSFSTESIRGLAVAVPEPSYFAYFAMLFLYSLDFLYQNKAEFTYKKIMLLKSLVIIMCIFTKSATVYLFLAIYLIMYINIKKIKRNQLFLMIIICFFTIVVLINMKESRINQVFVSIFNSFKSGNHGLSLLFYSDASGGFRFLINTLYFLSIFIHPFGYGIDGLKTHWYEVANYFNINVWNNLHFRYTIQSSEASLDAQSYMANIVGSIGIFSVCLFIFIFNFKNIKNKLDKNIYMCLVVFLIFYQSNFVNPVFWILLGFLKYSKSKEC